MGSLRYAWVLAGLALGLASCATRLVPYEPGPVRITRVDYREAPGPPLAASEWKLLVSKEKLASADAFVVTVLLGPDALGKTSRLVVSVAPAAAAGEEGAARPAPPPLAKRPADEIALADLRNTQIDIHVYFVGAPAGAYAVAAELSPGVPSAASRRLERAVTVAETP